MIYPRFVKAGDIVGVTALSCGITDEPGKANFENGKRQLASQYGLQVRFTPDVFQDVGGKSASGKIRSQEFNGLVQDPKVSWIVSAAGGDYLNEMLSTVDYQGFHDHPTWVQGYSDNTSILYALTTKSDVATIYGMNFSAFGQAHYQKAQTQIIDLLMGKTNGVESLTAYEDAFHPSVTGLEDFHPDQPVKWVNGRNEPEIQMSGRLLGGCTEVLFSLIGTPYEATLDFIRRYQDDGIVFFFETFSSDDSNLHLHFWQLKEAGWFSHCKGIIFGRPLFYHSYLNKTYREIVMETLGDLNVPMIFDADIGHKNPTVPMINGAYATIRSSRGKGSIVYEFK